MGKGESFNGDPRAADEVWQEGLMWVQAAFMQAWRFENAVYEQGEALRDAQMRAEVNDRDDESSRSWRRHYDDLEPLDPQRPLRVPSWALSMQLTTELKFLTFAVRNVMRAQGRIEKSKRPSMSGEDILKALRDAAEHWDRVNNQASRALAKFPLVQGDAVAYTNKEVWIGGVHGIPLSRINAWLTRVNSALRESLSDAGIPIPPSDLLASQIEGDDGLPWPTERLRFHWTLPIVDEKDWPAEDVPPELAKVMRQQFANKRARDHAD